MSHTPDFVVVGAGVVGCLTAWELARGGHRVTVLEAERVGAGASSGLGSRGVRANGRDPRELPLAAASLPRWPELARDLGSDVVWNRTGHLLLTERSEDDPQLAAIAERQTAAGIETHVVEGAGLRELEPRLARVVVAATWCPNDGVTDHTTTTRLAAAAAADAGAEMQEGVRVGSVAQLEAERGILIAANQGAQGLARTIGCELPLFPVYPQVVTARAPGSSPRRLIGHLHRRLVMKRVDEHNVMVTGGRLGSIGSDGEVTVDPTEVDASLSEAAAVFPELAGATVTEAVADRMESVTPDLIPIVDTIDRDPPVWVATGWSGHGFALAPAVAAALAAWMTTSVRPEVLAPLGRARFD